MKISQLTELEKQKIILGVSGLLALVLGGFFLLVPMIQKVQRLSVETSQVGTKIEVLKDIQIYSAQVREMEKGVLPFSEKHTIMAQVTGLANQRNLSVDSIQPEADPKTYAGYRKMKVLFQGSGDFAALMGFLAGLEKIGFPIAIPQFDLSLRALTRKKEAQRLDVKMQILTHMTGVES